MRLILKEMPVAVEGTDRIKANFIVRSEDCRKSALGLMFDLWYAIYYWDGGETRQERKRDDILRETKIAFVGALQAVKENGKITERMTTNIYATTLTEIMLTFEIAPHEDFWVIDRDFPRELTLYTLLDRIAADYLTPSERLAKLRELEDHFLN